MTLQEIKQKINNDTLYKPLWDDPNLGENIILLGLGGSYAYGTNVESSDIDIRGIAVNSEKGILLGTDFQNYDSDTTDTVIHSFNKIMKLLPKSNPTILEILSLKTEHYFYMTPIGKLLLDQKAIFLSKEVAYTYMDYAYGQLSQANKALANARYGDKVCKPLMNALRAEYTCFDILQKEELTTYRETERDILLAVRNSDEEFITNHGPNERYMNLFKGLEADVTKAKELSYLPDNPDCEAIEKFAMEVNRSIVTGDIDRNPICL